MMTWLADVLRNAGCKVVERDGWKLRGRGDMDELRGILIHHTGGPLTGDHPSLALVEAGRQDLAGPLSQLVLGRDGTFFVVAAGRCNHAGAGSWVGVTTGNSSFIGIECENAGTPADSPWPDHQMEALARGCAAIAKHGQFDEQFIAGHREYALPRGRKIDPLFDMDVFRHRVTDVARGSMFWGKVRPPAVAPIRLMLREGDQGEDVRELQRRLGLTVDGDFGPATRQKVRDYQLAKGLVVDGAVGPKTWAALGITNSTKGTT